MAINTQNTDNDLMAGLPEEGQIGGAPVMPPNMPHFDYDPQAPQAATALQQAPETPEARYEKVVREYREAMTKLLLARDEVMGSKLPKAPVSAQAQQDALGLVERNAKKNNPAEEEIPMSKAA